MAEEKVYRVPKKARFSMLDLVSNTEGESISATGLCGTLIIMVSLFVFIACTVFYFCNTSEADNVFKLINSTVTIMGIGAGVLGVRRISSDFGPNNRIVIGGSANSPEGEFYVQRKLYGDQRPTTEDCPIEQDFEQS